MILVVIGISVYLCAICIAMYKAGSACLDDNASNLRKVLTLFTMFFITFSPLLII